MLRINGFFYFVSSLDLQAVGYFLFFRTSSIFVKIVNHPLPCGGAGGGLRGQSHGRLRAEARAKITLSPLNPYRQEVINLGVNGDTVTKAFSRIGELEALSPSMVILFP